MTLFQNLLQPSKIKSAKKSTANRIAVPDKFESVDTKRKIELALDPLGGTMLFRLLALLLAFGSVVGEEQPKPWVMANLYGQLGNNLYQIATASALAWDNDAEAVFPSLGSKRLSSIILAWVRSRPTVSISSSAAGETSPRGTSPSCGLSQTTPIIRSLSMPI